jgi:flagellar hook-basal body complex protein FliE
LTAKAVAGGRHHKKKGEDMGYDMGAGVHGDRASIQADALALGRVADALPQAATGGHTATGGFIQSLHEAVRGVDAQDRAAADKMADVDSGRSDDLVGAMLASQQASLSFSMLMQVRNKVMGAVEDLVKLPL